MVEPIAKLALGLLTGIIFGFLLQKGRVSQREVIVGQLLFKDWTVAKIMGTAVIVGSVGVYALVAAGVASLHVKPMLVGGVVVGALLFGSGMAVLGYCPGTCVAACGEGKRDAFAGLLGMLVGAFLYVFTFDAVHPIVAKAGDLGRLTLATWTHTSPWLWVGGLVLVAVLGGAWRALHRTERRELRHA